MLKRYILGTKFDVLNPEDIVDALRYGGGIRNTFVYYIRVNRNARKFVEYECAENAKLIYNLDSPAEIKYEKKPDGSYVLRCYKYSKAYYRIMAVCGNESIEVVNCANHERLDMETYSTEEERISKKEEDEEREAAKAIEREGVCHDRTEGIEATAQNGRKKGRRKKQKKKKEAVPPKPPKQETMRARRDRYKAALEKALEEITKSGCGDGEMDDTRETGEVCDERLVFQQRDVMVQEEEEKDGSGSDSCSNGSDEEMDDSDDAVDEDTDGHEDDEEVGDHEEIRRGNCLYDAGFDRYGYGGRADRTVPGTVQPEEMTTDTSEVELEEADFVNGITNMSTEVRQFRNQRGRRNYYDMDVLHRGKLTGVEIRFMSECRHLEVGPIITAESAFLDAQAEVIEAEENEAALNGNSSPGDSLPVESTQSTTPNFVRVEHGMNDNNDGAQRHTDSCDVDNEASQSQVTKKRRVVTSVEKKRTAGNKTQVYECVKCDRLFSRKGMFENTYPVANMIDVKDGEMLCS